MPRMYALLILLFVVAIGANALVARASRENLPGPKNPPRKWLGIAMKHGNKPN
jgi:hypothetical protein